ncbi:MAG: hypothetical protein BA864_14165 [Desulfuromonadales bacterium C00003093]|nr:MAG: hypothetical protein BA864_14165 [Desulfuromonadales bacterium C00003093]
MIKEHVVQIIVDYHEAPSGLIDELSEYEYETKTYHLTTNVETTRLEIGDIICSDRVGIERKSVDDFINTIINHERDLAGQMADMTRAYKSPQVILEGETVFGIRGVHPEALRALKAMITVNFGIPIIPTMSVEETAAQVVTIARREQFRDKRKISIPHTKRSTMTMPQMQRYVVSSIGGGVGGTKAERLLKHFRSVRKVMNASIDELCGVEGIQKTTAEKIHKVIRSEYKA